MKISVDYPSAAEEREIVYRMGVDPPVAHPVISTDELLALQQRAGRVFVHHAIVDYVVRLVIATRQPGEFGMADVAGWVAYGASPRASLGLVAAGRALALIRGRDYVLPQDVLDVAIDVLPHRMVLSYDAIADGVPATHAVTRVLQSVPLPQVAPRQRATGPFIPTAQSAASQATTAPSQRPSQSQLPNGAHSAPVSPPEPAQPRPSQQGTWGPSA
jgi:MoxR-like ATPase